MTSTWPVAAAVEAALPRRFVALDQVRTVDVERLVKRLGELEGETVLAVLERLREMFAV